MRYSVYIGELQEIKKTQFQETKGTQPGLDGQEYHPESLWVGKKLKVYFRIHIKSDMEQVSLDSINKINLHSD